MRLTMMRSEIITEQDFHWINDEDFFYTFFSHVLLNFIFRFITFSRIWIIYRMRNNDFHNPRFHLFLFLFSFLSICLLFWVESESCKQVREKSEENFEQTNAIVIIEFLKMMNHFSFEFFPHHHPLILFYCFLLKNSWQKKRVMVNSTSTVDSPLFITIFTRSMW